jgi:hypothetical protein
MFKTDSRGFAICEATKKRVYLDFRSAHRDAGIMILKHDRSLHVYICPDCAKYHIGSFPSLTPKSRADEAWERLMALRRRRMTF